MTAPGDLAFNISDPPPAGFYAGPRGNWGPPPSGPSTPMKGQYYGGGSRYPYGFAPYPDPSMSGLVQLGKLVGLCCVATVGSLGNIYTISSCIVGDRLRKKGNMFTVSLSLAMLPITLLVVPSLAIHTLAGAAVSRQACVLHELVVEFSGCVSLFTLCAVSLENYLRLCHRHAHRHLVSTCSVGTGVAVVWALGGGVFTTSVLVDTGPGACPPSTSSVTYSRPHGYILWGIVSSVLVATALTYLVCWRQSVHLRRCTCQARGRRRPFPWDVELVQANAAVWFTFTLAWLPSAAVKYLGAWLAPSGGQMRHPSFTWLPLGHATLFNALYVVLNEDFRESYANLARYCCCKMSVHFGKRPRTDLPRPLISETRGQSARKSSMRVHVIPGYDMRTVTCREDTGKMSRASSASRTGSASRSGSGGGRSTLF